MDHRKLIGRYSSGADEGLKREEILHLKGKQSKENISRKKAIKDMREVEKLTFKPQITERSREIVKT